MSTPFQKIEYSRQWRIMRYVGVIAGILLIWWLGAWAGCYRTGLQRVRPMEALPYNTALLLETPHPHSVLRKWRQQPYAAAWGELHPIRQWAQDVETLSALFGESSSYTRLTEESEWASGAVWAGSEGFFWLLSLRWKGGKVDMTLLNKELKNYAVSTRRHRGEEIYDLRDTLGQTLFVLAQKEGLLLASRKAHAVELGLQQLERIRSNVFFAPNFSQVYRSPRVEDTAAANIYISLRDLPIWLGNLQPTVAQQISLLGQHLDWGGYHLGIEKTHTQLSGKLTAQNESLFWQSLSRESVVDSSNIAELLPDNTALSLYIGLDDMQHFYKAYNAQRHVEFEDYLLPHLQGELLFFLTNPTSRDFSGNKFVALRLKDTSAARASLREYANKFGELPAANYQNFEIQRIATDSLLVPIFGAALHPLSNPYYVFVGDLVVFCNSAAALQVWIEKYNFRQQLIRLPSCEFLSRSLSRGNHLHVFIQTKYLLPVLEACTGLEMHPFIFEQWDYLRHFSPITMQLQASGKGQFTQSIQFRHLPHTESGDSLRPFVQRTDTSALHIEHRQAVNVAWQYDLHAPLRGKPHIVKNNEDGSYCVAVQDTGDVLYLFNQNGELLWEYALELPILSDVYGLDYHNAKTLQLVFNTREHIYFIEKNGNLAKRIPLPAPASTGMLLIDYSKGVRLIVGCTNGNLYGYDKSGVPLVGWNPRASTGVLQQPLQFVRGKKQDYYVVGVFKGGRLGIIQFDAVAKANFVGMSGGNLRAPAIDEQAERIAIGLSGGAIQVANFKGASFNLASAPQVNQNAQFSFADLTGDTRKDYLRYSNGTLLLTYYDEKNQYKTAWQKTLEEKPTEVFALPSPRSARARICALHAPQQKIYLYDELGQLIKGFPLSGSTRFELVDFVGNGSESIVVGNGNKLVVYKLD